MNINTHIPFGATLFSRGLYSSWCHVPHYNLLFDCGEGCATAIGNDISNITKIFIGHGHGDHTLGLFSLIGCRNTSRGTSKNPETRDHNKPLEIFYPYGSEGIADIIDFVTKRNAGWLRYDLKWTPLRIGDTVKIGHNTFIRAFEMLHQRNGLSLGYVIYEKRNRLKPEFRGRDIPALLKSGSVNRDHLNEFYDVNLFAYCLDAYEIPTGHEIHGCPHVVMDCTFINPKDRTNMTHFTLIEALLFCHNNSITNMYAAHVSPRYDGRVIETSFNSEVTKVHYLSNTNTNQI